MLNFKSNFIEFCYFLSNWQYDSIGLDHGLLPNRQQAIIGHGMIPCIVLRSVNNEN